MPRLPNPRFHALLVLALAAALLSIPLLPTLVRAADIPAFESCGPRAEAEQWLRAAGAAPLFFSLTPVWAPESNAPGAPWQVVGEEEISAWLAPSGQTGILRAYRYTDPQHGEVVRACVILRGSGAKPYPLLMPERAS